MAVVPENIFFKKGGGAGGNPHRLLKNAARSHFLRTDGRANLSSMRQLNTLSGISTIPQPRSNTSPSFAIVVLGCDVVVVAVFIVVVVVVVG